MGKVIKGSTTSAECYTLEIPVLVGAAPPRGSDPLGVEEWEPLAAPPLPAPVEPVVDLEAIQAQAQALLDDAERTARAVVDAAHQRANGLLDDAAQRAQGIADEASTQGRDEGYAGGVREAQTAMSGMIETMRELIEATRAQRHTLLGSAEPELVRLAVGIAERVLHQQIALDHGVVVEMARAAIARIVDRETITIRVNPADVDQMREHRDELLALGDVKTMRVIEDQRVDRGGVILETDAGSIDAKISTQLTEVRKILHIVDDVEVQSATPQAVDEDESPFAAGRAS